jgi:hypothetical protein
LLPTAVYYEAFGKGGFDVSELPWKMAFAIQLLIPLVLFAHYLINRRRRRLWWEGVVALWAVVGLWMPMGSCTFFYFGFAPMPALERGVGLLGCIGGTIFWLTLVWRDYVRQDKEHRLKETLYIEEDKRFIYKGTAADTIVSCLPQRNPFTRAHFWLVSYFGPLLGGIFLVAIKVIPQSSGPHALFLIGSFLSFPLSQWMLGYFGVRTFYFHIYLPLQIERETGKKVILEP